MLRTFIQIILAAAVVAAGYYYGKDLIETAPEAKRHPTKKTIPLVETIEVIPQSYTVLLNTRGTVTPRTESTLIPQVTGQVVSVNENFRAGGFFEKGETLLQIDPVDYQLALTSAKAELAKMRLALSEESAQAQQAKSDWEKLGMQGNPDALVLRKPQLANARASLASAQARLKRAEVDLDRTIIKAPYAGRILEQQVDIGQYVGPSSILAKIYATDYVEVRLPLTDRQQTFIKLPESYRGETSQPQGPVVQLTSKLGGKAFQWQGQIVRTEGSIDTSSRQLFVIAQVNDPYRKNANGRPPLKIGQFVQATISGKKLEQVFVLPRSILVSANQVLIADAESKVQRRHIEILWQDKQSIVIHSGLQTGEQVISTSIPYATEGSKIKLNSEQDQLGTSTTNHE